MFQGISLNYCLEAGPDLLNNMFGLLLRFREQPVAVLAWLKNLPRHKYFWSNRVTEILSTSKESQWNLISGNGNPADPATRGIPLSDVEKL